MNKSELLSEIERLKFENEQLVAIVIDSNERIKAANDMADNYQRLFSTLFEVVKARYGAEFMIEDIPKLQS